MTSYNPDPAKSGFLTICFGQGGIQIGNAVWELINLEHGVRPDGFLEKECVPDDVDQVSMYDCLSNERKVPRCIFADLEDSVVTEIKMGVYRDLFSPKSLITGREDAANNFARGYYTLGREIRPRILDRVRTIIEHMPKMRGINLIHTIGGGTGSGLSATVLEKLKETYPSTTVTQFTVVPSSQISSAIVEPYNALLHCHHGTETDMNVMVDNESLYSMARLNLQFQKPTITLINRILAMAISSITVCERLPGKLTADLNDVITNLSPFPKLHYPIVGITPLIPDKHVTESETAEGMIRRLTEDEHNLITAPGNSVHGSEVLNHRNFAATLIFRGDFSVKEIKQSAEKCRKLYHFVDWMDTGFHNGLSHYQPTIVPHCGIGQVPRSITKVASSTAIGQVFQRLLVKFQRLHRQGAFMHWYQKEGMPSDDWVDAQESMAANIALYEEAWSHAEEEDPEAPTNNHANIREFYSDRVYEDGWTDRLESTDC